MDNWNKLARPPSTALKTIGGGRLKGMTDVNPQWRYQAMTEVYGPCGVGWKFTVDRLWTEPGPEKEVMAFAQASLHVKEGDAWSDPIPGIGGSMLVAVEKSGLHCSDEAFKMAVTDALSVAMKMLGVAADIYMGRWDGSKYKDAPKTITPTTGAKEQLTPEQIGVVDGVASRALDWLTNGSVEDAVLETENANMDADEKTYFWTLFDSKQRAAMKKEHQRIKEAA